MNRGDWILFLGSNSDIASASAQVFALEGYNIYLASRDLVQSEKEAKNIRVRYGVKVTALDFDAKKYSWHGDFYSRLEHKPVGVVMAFGQMYDQSLAQQEFPLAEAMVEVNYLGAISVLEIVASDFELKGGGFIIALGSVAGDRGRKSNYIYGSTKAALASYLEGLRHRMAGKNISIITIKPGFVATKMTKDLSLPPYLTASPDEVAKKVFESAFRKSGTVYVKPIWRWIMLVIRLMPSSLFHRTNL